MFRRSDTNDDGFMEAHIKSEPKLDSIPIKEEEGRSESDRSFKYTKPNLAKALEHYEHQLPRRVRDALQPSGFRINVPGELRSHDGEPAELYSPWTSSQDMIAEFGIGIDLYFYSLRLFNALFLVAAFISLIAITANEKENTDDTDGRLVGSTYGATVSSLRADEQGLSDILCTLILTVGFAGISTLLERRRQYIDENTYTTSDYSIVITNPDKEVQDPDEYREHFRQFGDVVLVTIVKNNGDLLRDVTNKKVLQNRLNVEKSIKSIAESNNAEYKDEADLSWPYNLFKPTVTSLKRELEAVSAKIDADMNKDYHPWRVYVTFNKEAEAKQCLKETDLTTREMAIIEKEGMGALTAGKEKALFKGRILNVNPAHEPDEIYYKFSSSTPVTRSISYLKSYLICIAFVVICYYIIAGISSASAATTAVFISIINSIIPYLIKKVDNMEIHLNDSDAQLSAMLKLTVTRCFNSGILIYLSVDHADRFGQEALGQIQSILIADAISTPFMRFLDLPGIYSRHVASRNVITQQQLDLLYSPQTWSLAERYTDTLKTVFVGMMYAVPLPSSLFITSFAMITAYVVDKYSLFRMWERPSSLDHRLAKMSQYFMFAMLWTHVFFSLLFFANWPFQKDLIADCNFICRAEWDNEKGETVRMEGDQEGIVNTYNAFNIIYLIVLAGFTYQLFFARFVYKHLYRLPSSVQTDTENVVSFRSLNKVSAYVPLVKDRSLTKPILFADVADLPERFAPVYDLADAFSDAPKDLSVFSVVNTEEFPRASDKDLEATFSQIMYYDESTAASSADIYSKNESGGVLKKQVAAAARATRRASVTVDEEGKQLPPGWAMKKTAEGRAYYVDHVNRTTSWKRPLG